MTRIAVDAMGGDFGEEPIVKGVIQALKLRNFEAVLVGHTDKIQPLIPADLQDRIKIIHADEIFSMSQSATDALRQSNTSIFKAMDLVRNGECSAVVSAGHSGATMSLATLRLGRLKNIIRPAIATLMPNSDITKTLVLDVGANVDCKAEYLFQFAIMGEAYAKEIMKIKQPRVGLISNGEEDNKGNEITKDAFKMISRLDTFVGNVEGNQIFDGSVDVVVCDGFIGNILLKTSEGVASAIGKIIKDNVKQSVMATLGAFMMKGVFGTLKTSIDYDEYGGAPLLGIKHCVIISHGKSSPKAIKNAIFQALKFSDSNINSVIEDEVACFSR